jgi:hypothetical protein
MTNFLPQVCPKKEEHCHVDSVDKKDEFHVEIRRLPEPFAALHGRHTFTAVDVPTNFRLDRKRLAHLIINAIRRTQYNLQHHSVREN